VGVDEDAQGEFHTGPERSRVSALPTVDSPVVTFVNGRVCVRVGYSAYRRVAVCDYQLRHHGR
jgi:hypothetical protein